jgi:hypothetical protein|tara:strand:- start:121 stop:345 length:225 start_codon:yes stop_codon:yes gene_type:complete
MQYFELRLTLTNGMDIFIRDHQFVVHVEERRRLASDIKTLGDYQKPEKYYAAAVNGYAVMESYDEVIAMLNDQK